MNKQDKPEISEKAERKQNPFLYQPGVSGNPAGRPKGTLQIPAMLKKIGKELAPAHVLETVGKVYKIGKDEKLTMFECFIRLAYMEAIAGNSKAWDFVSERTEGKVPQSMVIEIVRKPIEKGENPMDYLTDYLNKSERVEA